MNSLLTIGAALACSLTLASCGGGGGGGDDAQSGGNGAATEGPGNSQAAGLAWETDEVPFVRLTSDGHYRVFILQPGGIATIDTDDNQSGTWVYQKIDANKGKLELKGTSKKISRERISEFSKRCTCGRMCA